MKDIIAILTKNNETISTMESCTGGALASEITNIEGSSEVFNFGAVTYSNKYKIKLGVSNEDIDKYSVYSIEVARDMSKSISQYSGSTYGIGITGKLNRIDRFNPQGEDNIVYISIYNSKNQTYLTNTIKVDKETRLLNKNLVVNETVKLLNKAIEI